MSNSVRSEIARNLIYYRKRKHLTQADLGKKLGVKRNTISSWESGVNAIDVEMLFHICVELEISVLDIFGIYANATPDELSAQEKSMLCNYRKLPAIGQKVVDAIVNIYSINGKN